MSDDIYPKKTEEQITCWCGAVGTYDELFDDSVFDDCCGGLQTLHCECGGDGLCVCHHHGEVECPGCEECEGNEDYDDG